MNTGLNRRFRVILGAASIALGGLAFVAPALMTASQASGLAGALTVTDLAHGTTATQLAQSLVGGGVAVSNVTYTGTNNAAGAFTGGSGIIGFDGGIVLGSGSVQSTAESASSCGGDSTNPGKGVEGPNICPGSTTTNGAAEDTQLTTLAGFPTFDASLLEFDFVPAGTSVQFKYVFSSDEYNEFANTSFNDVFAFFVNGTNCALVPNSTDPVSINTINGGNPIGTDAHNPQFFVDNSEASLNTEMDGLTTVLTCTAAVTANQTNHMKLAIADGSDDVLDSNVFVEAGSLVSGTQIATSLAGGGLTGTNLTLVASTPVHDTATLSGVGIATAAGSVTYDVFSDAGCVTSVGSGGTKPVSGGVVPNSDDITLNTAGTYHWQASYSGDATHDGSKSVCSTEVLTLTEPSTSSTEASTSSTSSSTSSTTESTTSTTEESTSTTSTTEAPTSTTSSSTTSTTEAPTSTTSTSTTSTSTTSTTASTTSTTVVPASTTSTTEITALCKPGNGYGDKNHCHSGPPGQVGKKGESITTKLIGYSTKGPGRAVLLGFALLIGAVALIGRIPRRRTAR